MAALAAAFLAGASTVHANTDLRSLLAAAPSADWVELDPTPTILSGGFTAHSYAAYLQAAGSSPGTTESALNLYGFRDGYAREWEQRGSQDVLIERVFEFGDDRGASFWYADLKGGAQTISEYRSAVPISVPNSFAAAYVYADGIKQWRAEFWKGNLVFVIHTDADTNDLSTLAVQQATAEYESAPASTVSTAKAGSQSVSSALLVVFAAAIALIVVIAVVIVIAYTQAQSRRRRAAYANVHVSPDGHWWWDGQAWRPMPPPQP